MFFYFLCNIFLCYNLIEFEGLFNDWKDVLVNVCFFMPVGVYCFELIKKHRFLKGIGIAFLLTLILETIQLITTVGYFTFNDLDYHLNN